MVKAKRTTDISNLKWDSKTGYGGCFYEGGGRMLKDDSTYMSGLTVAKCIEYCGRGGYALAGAGKSSSIEGSASQARRKIQLTSRIRD